MKRRLRYDKIFICISVIFLLTLICIYGYRLIHFYKLERSEVNTPTVVENKNFYDVLISKVSNENDDVISAKDNNFKLDDSTNEYYFYGKVNNNYVYYSGRYFRILGIDKDKNIKLITEDVQTSLSYGDEYNFNNSLINKWLNIGNKNEGIFYYSLEDTDKYLTNTYTCKDIVNDIKKTTCKKLDNSNLISTISAYEYVRALANDSYLNNNSYYWTSTNSTDSAYYVFDKGGITTSNERDILGIRPVITLKGNTIVSGDGSKENPYTFENKTVNTLYDASVGEYLTYSNNTYRIIEKDKNVMKIAMEGYIEEDNNIVKKVFNTKNNIFDINSKNNIGYYLNNTFYESLENKDYLKKGYFYIGSFKTDDYSYKLTFENKINTYVGLYQVGELFINDYEENFTLNGLSDNMDNTIFVIDKDKKIYGDNITSKYKIRPVLYLDSNLKILKGTGKIDNKYEIGKW